MNNTSYWFARGYYDGRNAGTASPVMDTLEGDNRSDYIQGFGVGVTDFVVEVENA